MGKKGMVQFRENHPRLKGVSRYYQDQILPRLIEGETQRQEVVRKVKREIPILAVIAVVVISGLFLQFRHPMVLVMGGVFSIIGLMSYAQSITASIKANVKYNMVHGVCNYLGWQFSPDVEQGPDLIVITDNGLLPQIYHRIAYEDQIVGHLSGTDFSALECHMERKIETDKGHRWDTVFRGMVIQIDFHRDFLGRTVVLRDKGFFNKRQNAGMQKVGLVDPVFEAIFEAYGTDQVEARYLLTPDFMQKLVDLEHSVDGKNIRFGFLNGFLYITLETPDRFEAGSIYKPLMDEARMQRILDEVSALCHVIESVSP